MISRFAALSLGALVALALMAVPAGAAAPELRGVVSGSPYGASGGYVAVPVLYSKMTARRAGLKSPVGLMVVKRTARIKVDGAPSSLPIGLRVGDRFKGVAEVTALNKRIFYPRITFDEAPFVYFRSKELSLSELTRLLQQVQANLGALSKFTLDTFGLVAAQLAGLQKQIDDLRKLLAAVPAVDLSGIQKQIDDLNKTLNGLIAGLPDFSTFALKTQLPAVPDLSPYALKSYVDSAIAALNLGQYATDADLAAAVAGLQAQINALPTKKYVDDAVAGLQGQINALPTKQYVDDALAGLQAQINALPTKTYVDNAVAGLQAQINALPTKTYVDTAVGAVDDRVDVLCAAVKALDPGGAVTGGVTGFSTACP